MWTFAIQSNLAPGETFAEKVERLAGWGFDGVEVSGADLLQHGEALRQAVAGSPVRVTSACAGFDGWLVDPNPRARNLAIAQIKEMLAVGAELGTAGLVSPAAYGISARGVLPPYRYALSLGEERQLLVEGLQQIAESAARTGGILLLEPLNRYVDRVINTLAEAASVIEEVGSPHIKMAPDIFHMNIEEADLAGSLAAHAAHIGHVHLSDSNRRLPGQGHVDWPRIFAALHGSGYAGVLAVECRIDGDADVDVPCSLRFLRQMAQPPPPPL